MTDIKGTLNFHLLLSKQIGLREIQSLLPLIRNNSNYNQELLDLIVENDEKIGCNAAWLMTHAYPYLVNWLSNKQDVLKEAVLSSTHNTKKRLMLVLLSKLNISMHITFLNFCLTGIINRDEPVGIRCLYMKIAYQLCLSTPEMLQEFRITLELIELNPQPAIKATYKNILKSLNKHSYK